MLYCHAPDPDTPIEETAAAFDEVYRQGKFKKVSSLHLLRLTNIELEYGTIHGTG